MGRIKLGRAEGRAGGAGGRDTEPEAGGPGWARGAPARGLRPPVAQRCPGGGEGGRPRYLEDEGGPRAGSHRCRAPPTHPGSSPGPGPPRPSGAPGGARSPESGRGSEAPTEKPGTRRPVQQWRRGGSASPHEGPGRPGRGAGGKRDAGNAGAPGSGRSCAQTEPRPAIGAPLRRPGAGGEEGKFPGLNAGFPGGSVVKDPCQCRRHGSIPGSRRSPGGRNGNPLQYSCLEKSHGQRSQTGCSLWGHQELEMTE